MSHLYSEMSEQALLGLIFLDNANYGLVEGRIKPEDFYIPLHSKTFALIELLRKQGITVWPGAVIPKLVSEETPLAYLEDYFSKIFHNASLGANTLAAAHVISDCSYKRKLIAYAKLLNTSAEAGDDKACAEYQKEIAELSAGHTTILPDDPLEQLQAAFKLATNPEPMISSGITGWDETFGGIAKGVRYIIAGRAGAGKTALALNIAWNVARQQRRVRYIFFEGRDEEIWHRIMAREMRVPITSFRKGLTVNQQNIIQAKQGQLLDVDFAVVRDPRDVGEMIARCGPCDLIVLDGISSAPAAGADGLIERVAMITGYCKTLADKTGAAVLMLAHLNSEGIKQGGTGTGIFGGQAATFDPESIIELRADEDTRGMPTRLIEGIVTKNRYGELKTIKFGFNGEYMTYGDF